MLHSPVLLLPCSGEGSVAPSPLGTVYFAVWNFRPPPSPPTGLGLLMALEYSFTPCDRNEFLGKRKWSLILRFPPPHCPIYQKNGLPQSWAVYRVSELTWAHTDDFPFGSILRPCPGCTCFATGPWPRGSESFLDDQEVRNLEKGGPTSYNCQGVSQLNLSHWFHSVCH